MRHLMFAVALSVGAGFVSAQDVPDDEYWPLPEHRVFGTPASEADAEAVAAVIARYRAAWASEDIAGLLETFAPDAEWTNAYGIVLRGHDALREFLTELFEHFEASIAEEEISSSQELSIRYLGTDTAIVHSVTESGRTENRDGAGKRRIHVTYVLHRQPDAWKITHQMIMDVRL